MTFETIDDAAGNAVRILKPGAGFYVYPVSGGFDWRAWADTTEATPGWVSHEHTPGDTAGARSFRRRCVTCNPPADTCEVSAVLDCPQSSTAEPGGT